jgi:hypothetical protein
MQMRKLTYVPEKGHDVLVPIGHVDFNPKEHSTQESAAKALHAAIVKWAEPRGFNPKNIVLWAPDVAESTITACKAWTICWKEGPFEWAINLSGEMDSGPWGYAEPYNAYTIVFTY